MWGTPADLSLTITRSAVHPHGCGEHQIPRRSLGKHTGSSPRVWGTRDVHHVAHRINPVHPHGCGEHMGSHSRRPSITGSSPRVWGTPSMPLRALSRNAVHPHGCGEHVALRDVAQFISGSSPRVWGTRRFATFPRYCVRFIPTGVGNTDLSSDSVKQFAVHPHGCGEHPLIFLTKVL